MFKLAKQVVVDREGAKKFVTINVINAKSLGSAKYCFLYCEFTII